MNILLALKSQNAMNLLIHTLGDNNHGYSWGMAAVEMALLRSDALKPVPQRGTLDLVGQNGLAGTDTGLKKSEAEEKEKEAEKKEKKPFGF